MALTTADFASTILTYKLVAETGTNTTPLIDVTGGSGKLYAMHLDNTSNAVVYVKFAFTTTVVTVGTTANDMMVKIPASTVKDITMPDGIAFTNLSFWAVAEAKDNSSNAVASNQVRVHLVAS
tara:strand:+ start:2876 stop:3244 length:369 start_codon:yes stop_codon:yes gene_type:complete